jgi:hypothetical protein
VSYRTDIRELPLARRLLRLVVGLALLTLFAGTIMSGYTPPGAAGEVLRHNRTHTIDASPLFYSEVEHMAELEAGVRLLREQASPDR